jgi:hypothetical protein
MKIPWANLGTEAAVVRVSEVFLLCEPKERTAVSLNFCCPNGQGSAREEAERAFASKQGRLQLAQVLGLDQPEENDEKKAPEGESQPAGWGEQIAMKIVDNMQIFIDKVCTA